MLRQRKKKEKQTTTFTAWLASDYDSWGLKELQISKSCDKSKISSTASYSVKDSLQLSKHALVLMHAFWRKGNITE